MCPGEAGEPGLGAGAGPRRLKFILTYYQTVVGVNFDGMHCYYRDFPRVEVKAIDMFVYNYNLYL